MPENSNEPLKQPSRREVQQHGFVFQQWVMETFFASSEEASYTQEWDVEASANLHFGGVPVSIKTAKIGSSIWLGDALRQFQINQPFLMIVGFWQQEDKTKRIVNITAVSVSAESWKALWEPITFEELLHLDNTVKNRMLTYAEARIEALNIKTAPPFSRAVISINPKIDSKTQRRLQCSLNFSDFFDYLAPHNSRVAEENPTLFDVPALSAFTSQTRRFHPRETQLQFEWF